jgi:hypothetical protein
VPKSGKPDFGPARPSWWVGGKVSRPEFEFPANREFNREFQENSGFQAAFALSFFRNIRGLRSDSLPGKNRETL